MLVQAAGSARTWSVVSYKVTRYSPQLCRQVRISNCWPYKGWKGWVTVKNPSAREGDSVVDGLVQ